MTTSTAATDHPTTDESRLRSWGLVGAVASVVGAACAAVILAWQPMVAEERFSYPFDAAWFTTWQVVFAVQHAAMLPLFTGLLLLGRRHPSRALHLGTWVALVGQVALTVMELVAISAAHAPTETGRGAVVGALYAIPTMLLGVGLIVAGVGALRTRLFDGAARWLVLALGVFVFVGLLPALFGPMAAGRIAIGVWLLGFAALGLAIRTSSARNPVAAATG